jgi:poly(3-hydroxyoctanoate) depolymerase
MTANDVRGGWDAADDPDATHLPVQGLRTRIRVRGEGAPLLLIMGIWGGLSAWDLLVDHLPGYRTIAFDAPGIGGTDMPSYPLALPALARFATGVLDAVGVDRAHVLGVSFGGLVAQQMAVAAPRRIDRLVLASTTSGVLHIPGQPTALLRTLTPWMNHIDADAGEVFGGRIRRDPHVLNRLDIRVPSDPTAYLNRLSGLSGFWSMPWSVSHPTLVLTGDDDPIVPAQNSRILAACLRNCRLHVVRGGGHLVLFDSPAQVGPVIDEFLRQPSGDGRRGRVGRLSR